MHKQINIKYANLNIAHTATFLMPNMLILSFLLLIRYFQYALNTVLIKNV